MIQFTKELKNRWVAALRSGEYEQGRLKLKVDDKYCCLGVLAEVAGILGSRDTPECDGEVSCLWSEGLSSGVQHELYSMNDSQQLSFAQIADYIAANVPAVDEVAS
jgi:hypothetical protein